LAIKEIELKNIVLGFVFAAWLATSVNAQVKMDGQFVASQNCAAVQSIKKGLNPGNVMVESGKSYRLLGTNKAIASHYRIEILGANPPQRWVALNCGAIDGAQSAAAPENKVSVDTPDGTVKPKPKPKSPKGGVATYVLALSWEPAFCSVMKDKSECKNETASSYDATHFSLHGLWPQPRRNVFCGVDLATAALDDNHKWAELPMPKITLETARELSRVMPGTASLLERHEWIKHGTCYVGGDAETYFSDAIRLTNDVNASAVQKFMQSNIGRSIDTDELRAKFDEAYGKGAGERVQVSCSKDGLISELTISLQGDIAAGTSVAELIKAAKPVPAKCETGLVVQVR
jgi:ribonuclease T2